MRFVQPIWALGRFVLRESAFLAPFALDEIHAAALDEMPGQADPKLRILEILRREFLVDQREKAPERLLVAGMGRGGQHHQAALGIFRKPFQQFVTLLLALVRAHAGMGFVHDHEFRA